MMHENVTKTYKKCNTNKSNSINFKAKQIASKLKIDDRVQKLDENEAHVQSKISRQIILSPYKSIQDRYRKNKQTNIR